MTKFQEGFDAYHADKCMADNPYPKKSIDSIEWLKGWNEALQKDILLLMSIS